MTHFPYKPKTILLIRMPFVKRARIIHSELDNEQSPNPQFRISQRQEVNILTKNRSSIKKKQTKKPPNLLKVEAEQSSSLLLHFQNSSESYQLHKCTYLLRDGSQSVKSLSGV